MTQSFLRSGRRLEVQHADDPPRASEPAYRIIYASDEFEGPWRGGRLDWEMVLEIVHAWTVKQAADPIHVVRVERA